MKIGPCPQAGRRAACGNNDFSKLDSRKPAEPLNVKRNKQILTEQPDESSGIYYPAECIIRLLLDLKLSLGQAEGRQVSYDDWEQIAGRPANTIASWSAGGAAHQLQVLLASLERLAIEERHRLIDRACRDYPTLRHPKLAHDLIACSRLGTLLRQSAGLTFIQGGAEHMRTFVLTALGHSAGAPHLPRITVDGVDIHRPDAFVPVIGLNYLDNTVRHADIERKFNGLWPSIRAKGAPLILLNEIWRAVPTMHRQIMEAAQKSHVVVADVAALKAGDLAIGVSAPVHLVTVFAAKERSDWIRIEIQAI